MCGFKESNIDDIKVDCISLEKYVNNVQDVKRDIIKEILDIDLK